MMRAFADRPPPSPHVPHSSPVSASQFQAATTPSLVRSGSFASVTGRRKATPEEEAALLSRATSQAMVAARSLMLTGATPSTALATAKAAAESILLEKGGSGPYLSRRTAKQQVNVVASMALMAAQNALNKQNGGEMVDDHIEMSEGTSLFGSRPTNTASRNSETISYTDSNVSICSPPPISVIRQQNSARTEDPSSIGVSLGHYGNSNHERMIDNYNCKKAEPQATSTLSENEGFKSNADASRTESPTLSHVSQNSVEKEKESEPAQEERSLSVRSGNRQERDHKKTVARLLKPLEDYDAGYEQRPPSEEVNGMGESFSSEGNAPEGTAPTQPVAAPYVNPLTALFQYLFCGSDEELPEPPLSPHSSTGRPETRQESEENLQQEDSKSCRESGEEHRAKEKEQRSMRRKKHIRKSSETSSLGNEEIVRALETFEKERMQASPRVRESPSPRNLHERPSRYHAELRSSRTKESMEKVVLRALAASDTSSKSSAQDRHDAAFNGRGRASTRTSEAPGIDNKKAAYMGSARARPRSKSRRSQSPAVGRRSQSPAVGRRSQSPAVGRRSKSPAVDTHGNYVGQGRSRSRRSQSPAPDRVYRDSGKSSDSGSKAKVHVYPATEKTKNREGAPPQTPKRWRRSGTSAE